MNSYEKIEKARRQWQKGEHDIKRDWWWWNDTLDVECAATGLFDATSVVVDELTGWGLI